jgi:uncharacterized protein YjbI with pentapeptide repeats
MTNDKKQPEPVFPKIVKRFQKTLSSFVNAIAEAINSSVHIPEVAIGPIIGSLITAATTIIIGLITISNIFSEQFLYRPLQIQDNNANYSLELERYRQTILTDYLNQTTQLTLDYPLWKLEQNPYLLRGITQTVLTEIDGKRKRYVIMFLQDSSLLSSTSTPSPTLLQGADLTKAELDQLDLSFVNFTGADLSQANLSQSNLSKTEFSLSKLDGTNLTNADLRGANFSQSDLTNANLNNACYDVFTQFRPEFKPSIANMRIISPFSTCELIPLEKEPKSKG